MPEHILKANLIKFDALFLLVFSHSFLFEAPSLPFVGLEICCDLDPFYCKHCMPFSLLLEVLHHI